MSDLIWERIRWLEENVNELLRLQRQQERINKDLIDEYMKNQEEV